MEQQYRGILQLIRSALTGEGGLLPAEFSLEQAVPLVRAHQVSALVYEGARLCGVGKDAGGMSLLFQDTCRQIMRSERQTRAVEQLRAGLDRAGAEYLFFKGVVLKGRYPKPEMRAMGDADFLIHEAQYQAVDAVLREQGYELKKTTKQEWQYFSDRLMVEPHRAIVDPEDQRDLSVFGTGWDLVIRDEGGRPALPPEAEIAHLISHLAKHFRHGGVGLRHMTDLWVCRRAGVRPDPAALDELLARLGLTEFASAIDRTIRAWFEDGPEDEVTGLITRFVFESGSFGSEESNMQAFSMRKTGGQGVRAHSVLTRLFPARALLLEDYPILRRAPVLLPAVWILRLIRLTLFHRGQIVSGLRHIRQTRPDEVRRYAALLRRMGLEPEQTGPAETFS